MVYILKEWPEQRGCLTRIEFSFPRRCACLDFVNLMFGVLRLVGVLL
jgi:hypothetical protein